jgi:hypothetical protein
VRRTAAQTKIPASLHPGIASKPREALFHGVAALRLTPVGGEEAIFGRTGSSARGAFVGARLGWRATLFGAAAMSVAALAVTINERTNTQKICPRTLIAAAFLYSKTHKLKVNFANSVSA